jgi:3',5'-cyclic AMP phosphodiesterase CpdA
MTLAIGSGAYPQRPAAQSSPAVLVGAGDIAKCDGWQDEATARLLDGIPGTVFTAGDNAYSRGTAQEFIECYGLTWGRQRHRTRPSPGNHDYESPQAAPYFKYFGANAGPTGRGYYSYNLSAWHVVSLNSNSKASSFGAAQEEWLREDLASNPANCTLAYWHQPRFSSGATHGDHPHMSALYTILYKGRVSVLISGHDHIYERFAPQDPNAKSDPRGVRQFIAGTGGASLYKIGIIKPNSEVRNTASHGVLKFTLYSTGYDWEFIPIAGQNFRDRGSAPCSASDWRSK